MCLLHAVERWDNEGIVCIAHSHLLSTNPLRTEQGLPISAGIEYAAQAMAVHGALLASAETLPQVGYLASVRNVQWWNRRLDAGRGPLHIEAGRISGNASSLLYDFRVLCNEQLLLSGRAGVMVTPPATPQTTVAQ